MVGTALIVGGPETVGAFVGSGMAPPPHMQHIAAVVYKLDRKNRPISTIRPNVISRSVGNSVSEVSEITKTETGGRVVVTASEVIKSMVLVGGVSCSIVMEGCCRVVLATVRSTLCPLTSSGCDN